MTLKWLKPLGAASFLLMLCMQPGPALSAASEALLTWALSVAPALLPFLIAAPALTCPEVSNLLARPLGPVLRLFRLPENSAGALLIGFLSGSPAGAAALSSVVPTETDPPGAYLRAALMASGASPAFLLSSIAVSMLDSPETGWLLLRAQFLAVLTSGLLLRFSGSSLPMIPPARQSRPGAVSSAMQTLLIIGGYMALFSVLARLTAALLHPSLETPLIALLELAGGCRALASLPYDRLLTLPLISAAACFGGISVFMQCMSFLASVGVRRTEYAQGKLIQSALAALYTRIQLEKVWLKADATELSCLCLLLVSLALLISLRKKPPEKKQPS